MSLWESNPRPEQSNYIVNLLSLRLLDLEAESLRIESDAPNTVIILSTCYHYGFLIWKRSLWESNPRPEHTNYIVNLLSLRILDLEKESVRIDPASQNTVITLSTCSNYRFWFGSGVCENRNRAPNTVTTFSTCIHYSSLIWKRSLWESNPRPEHSNYIFNLYSLQIPDLEAESVRIKPAPRTRDLHCHLDLITTSRFGSEVCENRSRAQNKVITLSICYHYGFFIWKLSLWKFDPAPEHNNYIVKLLSLQLLDLEPESVRIEPGAPNTVIILSTCYHYSSLMYKRRLWESNTAPRTE
jgi:hypothetical protein